ncbi:MAG: tetratricopeptide repeat protein [Pirellulales bacterium]|nr:tetratricopeptide repeat protein [Pirellulales bacterium]
MNDLDRQPTLVPLYERYLDDLRTADFIEAVSARYRLGTLARLTEHPLRQVRRAAVLAIGFLGNYEQNGIVGRRLNDADRTVRTIAENTIRQLWLRDGEPQHQAELAAIARLNHDGHSAKAIERATALLRHAPWLAEAWNQRAIAHSQQERWTAAIADCHQALEINPYHFAAAAGMGQCYLKLERYARALECMQRALKLNPDLMTVRACVQYLQRVLKAD